ncbi:YDG domain-containing protein [Pseudomonas proteolytica]|uniref:YDG domain-containing protein n=1 Tax=Pseudomonas proteolytica TaxID=219574 RepID=UPI0023DFEE4D|nr:YDG domain-containing protein [Pseudomonas proteolytica]MDF3163788.1 YDG domain-containing protein [Pseudomonas proteolytica]
MNRIFSVIWNHSLNAWVVASENASRQGKRGSVGAVHDVEDSELCAPLRTLQFAIALILGGAILVPASALASGLPTGGQVVLGNGQILTPDQQQMVINQTTQKLAIDWQSFNIGADKKVTFVQPGKDSVALNRVVGSDGSKIMGQLNANGQVFLVNPNGVLFGKGSSVDVGGLVASTLDITNSDFAAGNYKFQGKGSADNASVVNQGTLKAGDGGAVALLGGTVSNQGVIAAKLGSVALAAGNKVTLDFAGDGLLNVQVDEATKNALVENRQLIQADGGQVIMTAKASDALLQTVVNNTGVIEAHTLGKKGGKIVLLGGFDGGTVQVAGTLDASAPSGGNGGFIETSGAHVKVADSAKITTAAPKGKTGNWLIDPTDYTIAATGGDITGAAVSDRLKTTNMTVATVATGSGAGNINVNDTVVWNANTLTLTAHNNVNINKEIFGSGSAKLAVEYGQGAVAAGSTSSINIKAPVNLAAGQNFSTRQGSDGTRVDYTVITSLGAMGSVTGLDLQGINGALSGNFVLGSNINAAATATWNGGKGFDSLGTVAGGEFTGTFDGLGHSISNLSMNRTTTDAGLFGAVSATGAVRNVGLTNVSIALTGTLVDVFPSIYAVGALVGYNRGWVDNSYASGAVTGTDYVQLGGLVGTNTGIVSNSHTAGTVTSTNYAGAAGLVSLNTDTGIVRNSYSTANVIGLRGAGLGGLVVRNEGRIENSSATGNVTSTTNAQYNGGLVSANRATGVITNSYATGNVTGGGTAGGLVGNNSSGGQITNSYATGNVGINGVGSGAYNGGLVGANRGSLSNVYSTGSVTGALTNTANNGGLVGLNAGGTVVNAYSVGKVTGSASGGLIGRHSGGSVTSGYYNMTVNPGLSGWGNDISTGDVGTGTAVGLSSAQMKQTSSFQGFNFSASPGATGNAWVMVNADSSGINNGSSGTLPMLASEYSTTITNAHQLQLVAMDRNATYTLGRDIVAGATAGTTDVWNGTFVQLGEANRGINFTGSLDGQGHVIKNLKIDRGNQQYNGLFGAISETGRVSNLGLDGGSISGAAYTGSIVGYSLGTLTGTFSSATVTAEVYAGGLVGQQGGGSISNSYFSGSVTATADLAGGLVGQLDGGSLSNNFVSGRVTASSGNGFAGGIMGSNFGNTVSSGNFWDTNATGQLYAEGEWMVLPTQSGGLTTTQIQTLSTFSNAGWDLDKTWVVYNGGSGPLLRSFMTQLNVVAGDVTKTYDGTAFGGAYTPNLDADSRLTGSLVLGGTGVGAINAGDYSLKLSGLASTGGQFGYSINYIDGTLSVNKATLSTAGTTVNNKVYDGTTVATLGGHTLFGLVAADIDKVTLSAAFTSKDAGTGIQVDLGLGGTAAGNYRLDTSSPLSANITPRALSITGLTADSKVYDGTTSVSLQPFAHLSGLVVGESVSMTLSGQFADANAANGKNVQINVALGDAGGLARNYNINPLDISPVLANITQKVLTISGLTANKIYDGSASVALSGGTLNGLVGTQTLGFDAIGNFADKHAGVGKAVTVAGVTLSNGSGLAQNYTVSQPGALSGDIFKAVISGISGLTALSKVYNGNTDAALSSLGATINGKVSGDDVVLASAASEFTNKNAGNDKTVLISNITLSGSDLGNYTFVNNTATATASITPKALAIIGMSVVDKVYDGRLSATLSGGSLSGLVGNETLGVTGLTATFADKNVGTDKVVTASGTTLVNGGNGGLASNYSLANPTGWTADITAKTLTVSGITANSKIYDGTTAATLSGGVLSGLVSGETLSLSTLAGVFLDANVGNAKTVTVSGGGLADGTGLASNYILRSPTGLSANISAKALTITGLTANGKVYDGNNLASLSGGALDGLVGSETLGVTGLSATFSDKNAGTGKTVTASGATLVNGGNGGLASNYSISNPMGLSADISAKALTISGMQANGKVYDGNNLASLSGGALDGLVGSETLGVTGLSATFSDKNAGTGKTVTASGATLVNGGNGGLASNYSISNPIGLSADISAKALTISGMHANGKVYDGNNLASLSGGALDGLVGSETLGVTGLSATFSDKNAGTGKTVTASGATLVNGSNGGLASNYSISNPMGLSADISAKALTLTGVTAGGKVYDGTNGATLSGGVLNGLVGSESLGVTGLGATFDDKNAGIGKTVTASGATLVNGSNGGLASNYSLSNPVGLSADISAKALTISGMQANGKVYDGNNLASLSGGALDGLVGGETLGVTGLSATFSDKNAGTGKTVTASGATLVNGSNGGLASNYSISNPTGLSADISAKTLNVTGITAGNKVYDAATGAVLNLAGAGFNGLVSGDDVSVLSATGNFSDKNAATGKAVNISDITLAGVDLGNYQVSRTAATTADITKAVLNVTVGDTRVAQGQTPVFDVAYDGLLGTDSVASDLSGSLLFSAPSSASAGEYQVSASGLSATNYQIAYIDGLLTVDAPPLAPLQTVVEVVEPLRNLPKPTQAPVPSGLQLPNDLYTLVDQGLRLPEGL